MRARALWFEGARWLEGAQTSEVAILLAAAALDFGVGDPWSWPHPVQAMGKVISAYSKWILALPLTAGAMRIGGVGLAGLVIAGSGGLCWIGLWQLALLAPWLGQIAAVVVLASCFAGRSLRRAAEDVLGSLGDGQCDLKTARSRLALYVGRDTEDLDAGEINRAVLETVSENGVDGVLAPLFYALLGAFVGAFVGLPFVGVGMAIAYKAASTLDSMVGYREAPYTDLGWFSARFEDSLTWLPCRLSVLTIALLSGRPREVLRLCRRDASADPSPNAGWSECAYAAALGVQLGGANTYRGKLKVKPTLGEPAREITADVVAEALSLTRQSFLIGLAAGTIGLLCLGF